MLRPLTICSDLRHVLFFYNYIFIMSYAISTHTLIHKENLRIVLINSGEIKLVFFYYRPTADLTGTGSRLIDCFTAHQHRKAISAKKRC